MCSSERFKPFREVNESGRRLTTSRCVELCQHRADYATSVVIPVASKIGKGSALFRAFYEDRILVVRHYTRRAVPAPPLHEQAADPLLIDEGYLEHGRQITRAHRQKSAAAGNDRFAVWHQFPALKIVVEHGREFYHALTTTARVGRSGMSALTRPSNRGQPIRAG